MSIEVANNGLDFSQSGLEVIYYEDPNVASIYPSQFYDVPELKFFIQGFNFVNITTLVCRVGAQLFNATFITPNLLLCTTRNIRPIYGNPASSNRLRLLYARNVYVKISVNGLDFTSNFQAIDLLGPCPTGKYCPLNVNGKGIKCHKGAYCPREGSSN